MFPEISPSSFRDNGEVISETYFDTKANRTTKLLSKISDI